MCSVVSQVSTPLSRNPPNHCSRPYQPIPHTMLVMMDIATSTTCFSTDDPTWLWLRYRMVPQMPRANGRFFCCFCSLQSASSCAEAAGLNLQEEKTAGKSKDMFETVPTIPISCEQKQTATRWCQTEIEWCKVFSLFFKHDIYQSNLKLHMAKAWLPPDY